MLSSLCVKLFVGAIGLFFGCVSFICWLNRRQTREIEASYDNAQLAETVLAQWRVCKTVCKKAINDTKETIKKIRHHKESDRDTQSRVLPGDNRAHLAACEK